MDEAPHRAILALSDESVFYGRGYGKRGDDAVGEVVFNTAMTGYQEILSDPSYDGQIVNFTHPHIGNTGVNDRDNEAAAAWARGMIARQICERADSWRATANLPDYLRETGVVGMDDADTRAITRRLRDKGALGGCLRIVGADDDVAAETQTALAKAAEFAASGGLSGALLAAAAGRHSPRDWAEGAWRRETDDYAPVGAVKRRVVALDCGAKRNILRELTARECAVSVLPYDSDEAAVVALNPDGVLFSNGPGDPAACEHARRLAAALLARRIPLFGLCLGHQVIAEALGAKTEKMKFGHHGANHPVRDESGRAMITSQNHGFAVRADSLPANCRVSHVSLFDGSLQGLRGDDPPFITFQGHPEASPGPHDAGRLFDDFVRMMDGRRR